MALNLDAEAPFQAAENGIEMLVVNAAQADFVVGVVMLDDKRGILFAKALQRA